MLCAAGGLPRATRHRIDDEPLPLRNHSIPRRPIDRILPGDRQQCDGVGARPSSNTAGHTKKTTVNAVSLIRYCVGFPIGPQMYRKSPAYPDAKWTVVAMWTIALLVCLVLYYVNDRENRRRDKLAAELPPQPEGQEFRDLTDRGNLYFRYVLDVYSAYYVVSGYTLGFIHFSYNSSLARQAHRRT